MKKLSVMLITSLSMLSAMEFSPLGFDSIGMGGAGVANANGSMAAYYNPALLAKQRYTTEISLGAGVGVRDYYLGKHVFDIVNTYQLDETTKEIEDNAPASGQSGKHGNIDYAYNIKQIQNELYILGNGNGLQVMPTAFLAFQIGKFGIGVYNTTDLALKAIVDQSRLDLIFKDKKNGGYYYYNPKYDTYSATDEETYKKYSLSYAIDNKTTYIQLDGLSVTEVPLSYGDTYDDFSYGISLKLMQGVTYSSKISLSDGDNLNDQLDGKNVTTSTFGVDVGFLYTPSFAPNFSVGLVGKDLNTPKFDKIDGSQVEVKPMGRAGIKYTYNDWMDIAFDMDLTENDTMISTLKSQYVGGGVNIRPTSWFSVRAGAMKNLVWSDEGVIATAGIGIGLKWFQLDLAAQASQKTSEFDGNQIPKYVKLNLSLISRWF